MTRSKSQLFTARHYAALATAVVVHSDATTRMGMVVSLAMLFALDNPRFDREKWFKACGYYAPKIGGSDAPQS